MWVSRIAYIEILAFAIIFYFIYPLWFAWYLLVLVLLLLPFDFLISLPGMLSRRVRLEAPDTLEQGEPGELAITAVRVRPFPAGALKLRLAVLGEQDSQRLRIGAIPKDGGRVTQQIGSSYSDVIHFTGKRAWVTSLMGFVAWPVKIEAEAVVVVLPAAIKHPQSVALLAALRLVPKPGGGFAEEHDLRSYRPGDPLNYIHWKLSAKHDELIAREALVSDQQDRLIEVAPWHSPEEREQVLGRLRWSSAFLLEKGLPHHVVIGAQGVPVLVTATSELRDFLRMSMLEEKPLPDKNTPDHFTWVLSIDATEAAA